MSRLVGGLREWIGVRLRERLVRENYEVVRYGIYDQELNKGEVGIGSKFKTEEVASGEGLRVGQSSITQPWYYYITQPWYYYITQPWYYYITQPWYYYITQPWYYYITQPWYYYITQPWYYYITQPWYYYITQPWYYYISLGITT